MKLKVIVSLSLALLFVISGSSVYADSSMNIKKDKIVVITDQKHEVEKRVQSKLSEDNTMNDFKNNYEVSYYEEIPQDNNDVIISMGTSRRQYEYSTKYHK